MSHDAPNVVVYCKYYAITLILRHVTAENKIFKAAGRFVLSFSMSVPRVKSRCVEFI